MSSPAISASPQVTLCDSVWQVTVRSSMMGYQLRAILGCSRYSCYGPRDTWKFQMTPALQSAPEQRALDRSAVSKHDARLLWRFWRPMTLTFDLFIWKLALHLLVPWGTSMPILIFLFFFCFRDMSQYGTTDGQTDGRTGKTLNAAYSWAPTRGA